MLTRPQYIKVNSEPSLTIAMPRIIKIKLGLGGMAHKYDIFLGYDRVYDIQYILIYMFSPKFHTVNSQIVAEARR